MTLFFCFLVHAFLQLLQRLYTYIGFLDVCKSCGRNAGKSRLSTLEYMDMQPQLCLAASRFAAHLLAGLLFCAYLTGPIMVRADKPGTP